MSLYVGPKPLKVGDETLSPGSQLPEEASSWRSLRSLINTGRVVWSPSSEGESHPLERVKPAEAPEDESFDPASATIDEVLAFVEANPELLVDVLEAEEEGKARKTLVATLQDMVAAAAEEDQPEAPEEPEGDETEE